MFRKLLTRLLGSTSAEPREEANTSALELPKSVTEYQLHLLQSTVEFGGRAYISSTYSSTWGYEVFDPGEKRVLRTCVTRGWLFEDRDHFFHLTNLGQAICANWMSIDIRPSGD